MEGLRGPALLVVLSVLCWAIPAQAKTAGEWLQEGLYAEEVDGDLKAAIRLYGQVIEDPSAQRVQAARALYRQGHCYLKLGDETRARAAFELLVADYSDQTRLIRDVKPMLEELSNSDPASLMPADTLFYMELGSLGRQIERVATMLKGTPLENPLAALAGGEGGADSPTNILMALLNPGMMNEVGKIRGLGIGITDLPQSPIADPSVIAVLYPGKSDALRGILLAALGMVSKPGETIAGMQTLVFPRGEGAVAYDESAIIVASPAAYQSGRLTWCINAHRGTAKEPTLSTGNLSFAKIDRKTRQENALTYWLNVDTAYEQLSTLFPQGKLPQEILMADGLLDFRHMEDLIGMVAFKPDGKRVGLDVQLKEGHQCTAYQLGRTPHLNPVGLRAVPADAIALATFALAEAGGAQAQAVTAQLLSETGTDIGSDLYETLDQVTFFMVPYPEGVGPATTPEEAIAHCGGLSIINRSGRQTLDLIIRLLTLAELPESAAQAQAAADRDGPYRIDLPEGLTLYGDRDPARQTTVLSLSPRVRELAVAALREGPSVASAGSLSAAIGDLPSETSKLILLNVGGAAEWALHALPMNPGDAQGHLEQFAQACRETRLQIHTLESENHLGLRSDVSGLPPINEVFAPMMGLLRYLEHLDSSEDQWSAGGVTETVVPLTATPPQIDGDVDDVWGHTPSLALTQRYYRHPESESDCSAEYRALYDRDNLYLLLEVNDDDLRNDSQAFYQDDSVEIFLDADDSKSRRYGDNDYHYFFSWDRRSPAMGVERGHNTGVQHALVSHATGYRLELALPWSTLGVTAPVGWTMGLDVQVNDDDGGGDRDSKIAWAAPMDNAWQTPAVFGTARLAGLVAHWPLDGNADDRSGNGHHGEVQGDPQWVDGRVGGALDLDGRGDYVAIKHAPSFNLSGQLTVAAWANIRAIDGDWMSLVTKGDSAWRISTEYARPSYHFGITRDTWLHGEKPVSMNAWHHVVSVYDGAEMRTYVDGRLAGSRAWQGSGDRNKFPVCIGENAEQSGRYWNGLIDDVRVYNYALGADEIRALYDTGQ